MFKCLAVLSVTGCGLALQDREICDAITLAASALVLTTERALDIDGEGFEGKVTNHFKMGCVGALSGMIFTVEADITTDDFNGSVKMNFVLTRVVTEEELSMGVWI